MKISNLTEDIQSLENDKFKQLINSDFSQAYQRALQKDFIFKGFDSLVDITDDSQEVFYGTPIKNRESRNTFNYYTLWINDHPDWSQYPDRNVICSNNRKTAMDYGEMGMGTTCVLLPKNDSLIGIVPKPDIWEVFQRYNMEEDDIIFMIKRILNKKGYEIKPNDLNTFVKPIKNIEFDDEIKDLIDNDHWIDDAFIHILREKSFYEFIRDLFSPTENGFDLKSIKDAPFSQSGNDNELWFDAEFLAIPLHSIDHHIG